MSKSRSKLKPVASQSLQWYQVKQMTDEETKEYHLKKLYELSLKSVGQIPQLEQPSEEQHNWIDYRMINSRSWELWDGKIEEWTPFNRFGEFINQYKRCYKK